MPTTAPSADAASIEHIKGAWAVAAVVASGALSWLGIWLKKRLGSSGPAPGTEAVETGGETRKGQVPVQVVSALPEVPPAPPRPRVPVRECSGSEVMRVIRGLAPLQRKAFGEREYVGRWVQWRGRLCEIREKWNGKMFEIAVHSPPESSHHVWLSVPATMREQVETLREHDTISFEGEITRASEGFVDVEGAITEVQQGAPSSPPSEGGEERT